MRYFTLILCGGLSLAGALLPVAGLTANPVETPAFAGSVIAPAVAHHPLVLRADELRHGFVVEQAPATVEMTAGDRGALLLRSSHFGDAAQQRSSPPEAIVPSEEARLRGERWAQQAREADQRGDDAGATQAWIEAVRSDPGNSWHRLALAQGQMRAGQRELARVHVEALLQVDPGNEHGLYLRAQLAAQEDSWADALASLERIPLEQRAPYMLDLRRRARVNVDIGTAKRLAGQGQQTQAWQVLRRAEASAGNVADLIGALAFAYLDIGAPDDGLSLLRDRMRREAKPSAALSLEYAGFLLKKGDSAGFNTAMDGLGPLPMDSREHAHHAELRRLQGIRAGETFRERGELPAAERKLAAAVAGNPEDAWAQAALARLRLAQNRPAEALVLYRSLLERDPQHTGLLLGAAWAAVQTGDKAGARLLANRAVAAAPNDEAVRLDAASVARAAGGRTHPDERTPVVSSSVAGAQATAGVSIRQRGGDSGTLQLSAIELPMAVQTSLASGQLSLAVTPVYLEAGEFSGRPLTARTFGGGPLLVLDASNTHLVSPRGGDQYSHYARGVGASLGYQLDGLSADVGVSPAGFLFNQVVGGFGYEDTAGSRNALWYSITLERRSVTDSILSWGGTFDPRGGDAWGGVVRTGGLLRANYDFGAFAVNGYGGYDVFDGENVRENHRSQIGITAQFPIQRSEHRLLRVGLGASLLVYGNNQSHFTWGHGGYFSPQQYWWAGVPVEWAWRGARLSYRLNASLGFQAIAEDAADYFPTDGALQDQAAIVMTSAIAGAAGIRGMPVYAAEDSSGMAYNIGAVAEYVVADRYVLGVAAGFDNAADYSQWNGSLYLRYLLTPESRRLAFPIVPFTSPYVR